MRERVLWIIAGACLIAGVPLMLVSAQFLDDAHTQFVTLSGRVVEVNNGFVRVIPSSSLVVFTKNASMHVNESIKVQGVLAEFKGKLQLRARA